MFRDR